jgi:hypothetical protein
VSALLLPEGIEGGDENAARVTCVLIEPTKRVRRNIDPQRKCFRSRRPRDSAWSGTRRFCLVGWLFA